MTRVGGQPKADSFNFRVDPALKAAFSAATAAEDKPAGQVLREFMRVYVEHRRSHGAARQSSLAAILAADPNSDESEVMRWIEDVSDRDGWTG